MSERVWPLMENPHTSVVVMLAAEMPGALMSPDSVVMVHSPPTARILNDLW